MSEQTPRGGRAPANGVGVMTAARPERTRAEGGDDVASVAMHMRTHIEAKWQDYYPQHASAVAPTLTLTPRHFGFSLILQAELAFGGGVRERLMIKIRRQQKHGSFVHADLSERILGLSRAEFDEHARAYAFFHPRTDGLDVVRPVDFIASHNAFVVEHARGQDLSKLARVENPITAMSLNRCGTWWRLFHHDLHGAQPRPWQAGLLDDRLEARITRLLKIGAASETLDALRTEFRTAAAAVPPTPVPVSLVHGDCKLRHVWATEAGIQVLDFGNAKVGDSWMDPAALVVELSLYSLWTHRLDSAARIGEIRTLLDAYFGGPAPRAFSLYVVDCLLKKWHRRLRNWGSGSGLQRLRRTLSTAGLDTHVDRLYIDRWFTSQVRAWLARAEGRAPAWLRPLD